MKKKLITVWKVLAICLSISFYNCNNTIGDNSSENQNAIWVDSLITAYKALNEERDIKSANLLVKASELMPNKNWENYLVAATIYAPNGENDKAFDALEKALEAGLRDSELLNSIPEFSSLQNDPKWIVLADKVNRKRKNYLNAIENPKLLEVLENMWKLDQQALADYEQNIKDLDTLLTDEMDSRLFEPVETRWEINKYKLDSIINRYGWPGNKLVGEDGAKLAWAIPQHHPDVFFKEKCLNLIKNAMDKGDVDPNHYAELNDRIARSKCQKQTYGASMGVDAPYPIEDPANVNKRRLTLGLLEPIEVYAYYHGITYQSPTIDEANQQLKTARDNAQNDYLKFEQLLLETKIDSANLYIRKAIRSYGDITNEQLYQAAVKLAQTNNKQSENLSLKILKVLIWRKWKGRYAILNNNKFNPLYTAKEWNNIIELMQTSEL